MIVRGRGCKMPCESCAVQFSVFRRKRVCSECERTYCAACLRRGGTGTAMCAPCRALSTRPLCRQSIAHLKVRDLQCFLHRQNVSTRGCVEKDELVSLCVSHVNSASYRRRGPHAGFTFKGLTTNINEFINSAFDLRNTPPSQHPPSQQSNCYNAAHAHSPTTPPAPTPAPQRDRFTTRPGGEPDIEVSVPAAATVTRSESAGSTRIDSADCFEIEDLDDAGWEFVSRAADPLPNDSEVLMTVNEVPNENTEGDSDARTQDSAGTDSRPSATRGNTGSTQGTLGPGLGSLGPGLGSLGPGLGSLGPATPQRAVSELELNRSVQDTSDTTSLQDEPLMDNEHDGGRISLEQVGSVEALEALSVRQLKELLARNRVEFRGCLERKDLLQRARTLWRDHIAYRDQLESLPIEECCKICMAAPLECVLLECGHIAACTRCSTQLAECPICRQYVVRAVRCFRS